MANYPLIAASLGFVLCASIVAFLLRGKEGGLGGREPSGAVETQGALGVDGISFLPLFSVPQSPFPIIVPILVKEVTNKQILRC